MVLYSIKAQVHTQKSSSAWLGGSQKNLFKVATKIQEMPVNESVSTQIYPVPNHQLFALELGLQSLDIIVRQLGMSLFPDFFCKSNYYCDKFMGSFSQKMQNGTQYTITY